MKLSSPSRAMRVFFAILATIWLCTPVSAGFFSTGIKATSAPTTCPQTGFPAEDGCAAAPAYFTAAPAISLQPKANIFTDGSTLFSTPGYRPGVDATANAIAINANLAAATWNVPGRDYAIGVTPGVYCNGTYVSLGVPTKPCSTTANTGQGWDLSHPTLGVLIDASLYDWAGDPANICNDSVGGKNIKTSYADGSFSIRCAVKDTASSSTLAMNVNGFDFTPGSTCISMSLKDNSVTGIGTLAFTNNRFVLPASSAPYTSNFPAACDTSRYNSIGALSTVPFAFSATTKTWNFKVWDNWLDPQASLNHYSQSAGIVTTNSLGTADYEYNYGGDNNGRVFNAAVCGLTVAYNFSPTLSSWPDDPHGEFILPTVGGTACATTYGTLNLTNNVISQRYNRNASNVAEHLAIGLQSGTITTVTAAQVKVRLNILLTALAQPNQTYWFFGTSIPGSAVPDITAQTGGTYATGDILTVHNGCAVEPTVRLYAVSGTVANAEPWTGGSCNGPLSTTPGTLPSSATFFSTACVVCASGGVTGATVKSASGYFSSASGDGEIGFAAVQSPGGVMTLTALDVSGNLLLNISNAATPITGSISNGSTMCYGTRTRSPANVDLVTGAEPAWPANLPAC